MSDFGWLYGASSPTYCAHCGDAVRPWRVLKESRINDLKQFSEECDACWNDRVQAADQVRRDEEGVGSPAPPIIPAYPSAVPSWYGHP